MFFLCKGEGFCSCGEELIVNKYHLDKLISKASRTITMQSTVHSHVICYSL